ncbi:hypothetical protein CDAR_471911 [Caerostris darwini]|uniref:Uncharacterized protein n=1 Tax=Caerostris darwini TaxID=1538125 RepID=A0AAV4VMC3_9ARAC|nr:hypothetical protein CDAR_471911 [Caerostris darwini]
MTYRYGEDKGAVMKSASAVALNLKESIVVVLLKTGFKQVLQIVPESPDFSDMTGSSPFPCTLCVTNPFPFIKAPPPRTISSTLTFLEGCGVTQVVAAEPRHLSLQKELLVNATGEKNTEEAP